MPVLWDSILLSPQPGVTGRNQTTVEGGVTENRKKPVQRTFELRIVLDKLYAAGGSRVYQRLFSIPTFYLDVERIS